MQYVFKCSTLSKNEFKNKLNVYKTQHSMSVSVSSSLKSYQDKAIIDLLKRIAEKYSLDKDEVIGMYTGATAQPAPQAVSDSPLQALTRVELVTKCKDRGLKVSGTKIELIARLEQSGSDEKVHVKPPSAPSSKSKVPAVLQKIAATVSEKLVKRNNFGNYEHVESGLVLDPKTQKVYGRQAEDGAVVGLTPEDIEECHKYKFNYVIPENLDTKAGEDDVLIDELDIEDDEEDDDLLGEVELDGEEDDEGEEFEDEEEIPEDSEDEDIEF